MKLHAVFNFSPSNRMHKIEVFIIGPNLWALSINCVSVKNVYER